MTNCAFTSIKMVEYNLCKMFCKMFCKMLCKMHNVNFFNFKKQRRMFLYFVNIIYNNNPISYYLVSSISPKVMAQ